MADFCKQCSINIFGEDSGDLKGIGGEDSVPLKPGYGYAVICEGCGPTLVDEEGTCIHGCIKKHNVKELL